MADMVVPPPAPQSELEGMKMGKAPIAEPIPNSPMDANGLIELERRHGSVTQHPESKKFTRPPTIKTSY